VVFQKGRLVSSRMPDAYTSISDWESSIPDGSLTTRTKGEDRSISRDWFMVNQPEVRRKPSVDRTFTCTVGRSTEFRAGLWTVPWRRRELPVDSNPVISHRSCRICPKNSVDANGSRKILASSSSILPSNSCKRSLQPGKAVRPKARSSPGRRVMRKVNVGYIADLGTGEDFSLALW
jgi:hypothetical protein